jgi:hypothetical protein
MDGTLRLFVIGAATLALALSGTAGAQSGATYTIITDSSGNVVSQLQGTGYTMSNVAVDPNLAPQPTPVPSVQSGWTNVSWGMAAMDIAVGLNGSTWFVAGSGTIYGVNGSSASPVAGGVATRIAVEPSGTPWCVTSGHAIFRLVNGQWAQQTGSAIDIGIGGNGKIYILNVDGSLASWNGSGWTPFAGGGGGQRISVDQNGNPWVTNAQHVIYRWTGTQWTILPGQASDISIGPDGTAYVLGLSSNTTGFQVYRWDTSVGNWSFENVYGIAVAAGSGTHAYVSRAAGSGQPTIMR